MSRFSVLTALILLSTVAPLAHAQSLVRSAANGGDNPQATPGGSLSYGTVDMPSTLNPFVASSLSDANFINILLPALMSFNSTTLKDDTYAAVSATVSKDGKSITYKLRDGLKWSDGQDLNADDVIYSAQLHTRADINSRYASSFLLNGKPITWTKVDSTTVRQTLPSIDAVALDLATWPILPEHIFRPIFEKDGAAGVLSAYSIKTPPAQIVTGGPFTVVSYKIGEELQLKKNPRYFVKDAKGRALPYLDTLIFKKYADPNALLAGFLSGQIDVLQPEQVEDVAAIRRAIDSGSIDATLKINAGSSGVVSTLHPNLQQKDPVKAALYRNVKFRQAISYLVDRDTIVKVALGGLGKPLYGPVTTGNTRWYDPSAYVEGQSKFSYDPKKAAQLLSELGYKKKNAQGFLVNARGQSIKFTILASSSQPIQKSGGQIVIDDLKAAGLDVTLSVVDNASVVTPAIRNFNADGTRNFDWLFTDFGAQADPPTRRNLYNLDGAAHIYNLAQRGQKRPAKVDAWELQLDKYVFAGLGTLDQDQRFKIYSDFQKTAAHYLPYVYIYSPSINVAYRNRVQNTQDQLNKTVSGFQGSQNAFMGENINYLDTIFVKGK
ncbi:ABC transporter substrate-binding protein [Deinococcus sp. UYEF24]